MSRIVSNFYTSDTYTQNGTADTRGNKFVLTVHGAAVYAQWQEAGYKRPGSGFWTPEVLFIPGTYTYHIPIEGVRVRSAITGLQALVTIVVD